MLALPAVSAPAGIVPTSAGLVAIWALLTLDALLIAEVNLAALAARSSGPTAHSPRSEDAGAADTEGGIVTLRQMAEFSLGKAGKGQDPSWLCALRQRWAALLPQAGMLSPPTCFRRDPACCRGPSWVLHTCPNALIDCPAALTLVYLALAYSLLTAYCTKAAEVGARLARTGRRACVCTGACALLSAPRAISIPLPACRCWGRPACSRR